MVGDGTDAPAELAPAGGHSAPVGMMDIRLPGNARVRVRPLIGTAGLREVILEAKTVLRCSWRRAVEST
jgi:hypothetical protein